MKKASILIISLIMAASYNISIAANTEPLYWTYTGVTPLYTAPQLQHAAECDHFDSSGSMSTLLLWEHPTHLQQHML